MSQYIELEGLKDHLTQACAAGQSAAAPHTLTRPVTVIHRIIEDSYRGTMPLVEVFAGPRNVVNQTPTEYGPMAQTFDAPNLYTIRIRSAIDPDNGMGPDEVQTEIMNIGEAIEVWFSVVPHRCLPDGADNPRVEYAGPPLRFRPSGLGPYTLTNGVLGQVSDATITVLGIPRDVSAS